MSKKKNKQTLKIEFLLREANIMKYSRINIRKFFHYVAKQYILQLCQPYRSLQQILNLPIQCETIIYKTQINECGYTSINLCFQKQVACQICFMGYSSLTSILEPLKLFAKWLHIGDFDPSLVQFNYTVFYFNFFKRGSFSN